MAGQPDLIISDVDILRDVLVRNFDSFTNRRVRMFFKIKNNIFKRYSRVHH
jgi:hypothetical protein